MNCNTCKKTITDQEPHTICHGADGAITHYLCGMCARDDRLSRYRETGEISSTLSMETALCRSWWENGPTPRFREDVAQYYACNLQTLRGIWEANEEIAAAARQFEETRWLGGIQAYYNASPARGHSCEVAGMKALLWGSAGRVLLTLQDAHPQHHAESRFGGAWLTLIFDEDSAEPRGGVQGMCATKDEALDLLRVALEGPLNFVANGEVTVA